jgi:hypothetical protein
MEEVGVQGVSSVVSSIPLASNGMGHPRSVRKKSHLAGDGSTRNVRRMRGGGRVNSTNTRHAPMVKGKVSRRGKKL